MQRPPYILGASSGVARKRKLRRLLLPDRLFFMRILELQKVVAGYRPQQPVLNEVDFGLQEGDFVALVGPNGCGKSTLLRVATGVLPPASGRVLLGGEPVAGWTPQQLARRLGVVPQETRSNFAFSVYETVFMGRHPHMGRWRGPTAADVEAVEWALLRTGTEDLRRRNIAELSGGERQRVIIARALAQRTPLLFLDEPTNHLDINHQVEVFELLSRLNQDEGLTLACITHDLNFAAQYCRRLVLMCQGAVLHEGPPEAVLHEEHLFRAYGIHLKIVRLDGRPYVVPQRQPARRPTEEMRHVGKNIPG